MAHSLGPFFETLGWYIISIYSALVFIQLIVHPFGRKILLATLPMFIVAALCYFFPEQFVDFCEGANAGCAVIAGGSHWMP